MGRKDNCADSAGARRPRQACSGDLAAL